MKVKRYLFVCKHNFTRSKHGAEFFEGFLKGSGIKGKVDSAGIGLISVFVGKRINKELLKNFDVVFVMEKYMKDLIIKKFDFKKEKIIVLGVADVYGPIRRKSVRDLDKVLEKIDWMRYIKKV